MSPERQHRTTKEKFQKLAPRALGALLALSSVGPIQAQNETDVPNSDATGISEETSVEKTVFSSSELAVSLSTEDLSKLENLADGPIENTLIILPVNHDTLKLDLSGFQIEGLEMFVQEDGQMIPFIRSVDGSLVSVVSTSENGFGMLPTAENSNIIPVRIDQDFHNMLLGYDLDIPTGEVVLVEIVDGRIAQLQTTSEDFNFIVTAIEGTASNVNIRETPNGKILGQTGEKAWPLVPNTPQNRNSLALVGKELNSEDEPFLEVTVNGDTWQAITTETENGPTLAFIHADYTKEETVSVSYGPLVPESAKTIQIGMTPEMIRERDANNQRIVEEYSDHLGNTKEFLSAFSGTNRISLDPAYGLQFETGGQDTLERFSRIFDYMRYYAYIANIPVYEELPECRMPRDYDPHNIPDDAPEGTVTAPPYGFSNADLKNCSDNRVAQMRDRLSFEQYEAGVKDGTVNPVVWMANHWQGARNKTDGSSTRWVPFNTATGDIVLESWVNLPSEARDKGFSEGEEGRIVMLVTNSGQTWTTYNKDFGSFKRSRDSYLEYGLIKILNDGFIHLLTTSNSTLPEQGRYEFIRLKLESTQLYVDLGIEAFGNGGPFIPSNFMLPRRSN